MGSGKEAVYAIADYLYHEDNTAWEKVGIKLSQTRAEDFAGYLDTYCDAADHIVARQTANKCTDEDLAKELKTLKANYQTMSGGSHLLQARHNDLEKELGTLKANYQTLCDSYHSLKSWHNDLLSRFEKLDIAYKRRMGNY
ncbi:hypothetical protein IW150_002780 [Coemansia sp. RSA 2607]|nr:hypothetical protein IW150_002780 [Coemansia sp. RSA 2607]